MKFVRMIVWWLAACIVAVVGPIWSPGILGALVMLVAYFVFLFLMLTEFVRVVECD